MSEHKRRGQPPKFGTLSGFDTPAVEPIIPERFLEPSSPQLSDTTDDQLKTLLKAIYDAGQLGIRRNLEADLATIKEICA